MFIVAPIVCWSSFGPSLLFSTLCLSFAIILMGERQLVALL